MKTQFLAPAFLNSFMNTMSKIQTMKTQFLTLIFMMMSFLLFAQTSSSYSANTDNVSGSSLVSFGKDTGSSATSSVFVGFRAGRNNQMFNNTFIGNNAGNLSNDNYGTYLGSSAGTQSEGGDRNVAIGTFAGAYMVGAKNNVMLGDQTGYRNTGDGNLFIGNFVGSDNDGNNNVFIGSNAGDNNGAGSDNLYLGGRAGNNNTGSRNILIGSDAGQNLNTANDKLVIDNTGSNSPLIYGDFASDKLGINTTNLVSTIGGQNISHYSLYVDGGLLSDEVRVRTNWADYVFEKDYTLRSVSEVEDFILKNGHLPNCPSEAQVLEQGLELGDITKIQQEKIEELTLYIIQQHKMITALDQKLELLSNQFKSSIPIGIND